MTRRLSSLKGAHLVMWSSPLLLLVLVFTLSTSTPVTHSPVAHDPLTPSTVAATTTPTTIEISRARPATRTPIETPPATPPAAATHTVPPAATTSAAAVVTKSVSATGSNVKSPGSAPSVSVANGVLSGVLSPEFDAADLPLQGPGIWTLTTSATLQAQLECPSQDVQVLSQVAISDAQRCQLQLTATNPRASTTWQLTPTQ